MRSMILRAAVAVSVCTSALLLPASGASASTASGEPKVIHSCGRAKPGMFECFAERVDRGKSPQTGHPDVTPSGYGPSDLKSAYNLPTVTFSGTVPTIAIVDAYDAVNAESDLATYRSQYGLPACTTSNGCFRKVNQSGQTSPLPASDSGWAEEISLDIDMASAVCPNCHILLVESTSPTTANLGAGVNTAVSLGATVVSNSYGGGESSSDPTTTNSYYNHPGVAIFASSGDGGYGVEFPAAAPTVTAVGGTNLVRSSTTRGWTETVWGTANNSNGGAGSGCSTVETKPSWQHDTGCAKRTVADVSAVADPATGVAVYDSVSGGWLVFGGTSVASPVVASTYALTSHGAATPQYPYSNSSFFYDVTSGTNGSCGGSYLCTGSVGYDGPTGIGTPNGAALNGGTAPPRANDFSLTANPSSVSVAAGSTATASVSAQISSGSAQSVALSATGPTGVSLSFSPTTITTGGAASTLTIAAGASAASGTITVTGTAASGTHTVPIMLTVSGGGGGGACSTTSQLLANPGFESGNVSWTTSSGVIDNSGTYPAHSGSYLAWLDGYGQSHTDTLSQTVTVPSTACTAVFSYWQRVVTAETTKTTAYDKLTVSVNGTVLATYSNLNASSTYVQKTFTLTPYAGKTVTLTFKGVEDSSLATSFLIDDTAVTVTR